MLKILKTRLKQKYRTIKYPESPAPRLPLRFAGKPFISDGCITDCKICAAICPLDAVNIQSEGRGPAIDLGKCIFCRLCEKECPHNVIKFSSVHRLASSSRSDLIIESGNTSISPTRNEIAAKLFSGSLKLRQVSAGGCNACEADCNVLGTPAWDMGRFGIQFVASPRHADGLLITGPVTENMRFALEKTYAAVPSPKIVIAVGTCAISGGIFMDHPEQNNGAASIVPVDLYIPGCPPHPLTILNGLLGILAKI